MKLWDPANDVTVFERGKEGVTHGWGVTMEQEFLARLAECGPVGLAAALTAYQRQRQAELRSPTAGARRAPLLPKLPPRLAGRLHAIRQRAGMAGQPRSLAG